MVALMKIMNHKHEKRDQEQQDKNQIDKEDDAARKQYQVQS